MLHIFAKTNKQTKQNKKEKEKKKEDGKKEILSRIWTQYLRVDPTSRSHYPIEDGHVMWWKVWNLMPFPWNFRLQTIEPYLTNWKKDSKQSDEIKANWNQATDSKKQCKRISWQFKAMKEHMRYKADTTPSRSRTQNISLCFLISISAVILKLMPQNHIHFPPWSWGVLKKKKKKCLYLPYIHSYT